MPTIDWESRHFVRVGRARRHRCRGVPRRDAACCPCTGWCVGQATAGERICPTKWFSCRCELAVETRAAADSRATRAPPVRRRHSGHQRRRHRSTLACSRGTRPRSSPWVLVSRDAPRHEDVLFGDDPWPVVERLGGGGLEVSLDHSASPSWPLRKSTRRVAIRAALNHFARVHGVPRLERAGTEAAGHDVAPATSPIHRIRRAFPRRHSLQGRNCRGRLDKVSAHG